MRSLCVSVKWNCFEDAFFFDSAVATLCYYVSFSNNNRIKMRFFFGCTLTVLNEVFVLFFVLQDCISVS